MADLIEVLALVVESGSNKHGCEWKTSKMIAEPRLYKKKK